MQGAESSGGEGEGLETVIVTSEKLPDVYSGGQVARGSRLGLIGNRDVMDAPFFSTVNYTNEYIKNIGAVRLTDVLTSDPSVTLTSTVARGNDTILIRGFRLLTENMTFDGLYGSAAAADCRRKRGTHRAHQGARRAARRNVS